MLKWLTKIISELFDKTVLLLESIQTMNDETFCLQGCHGIQVKAESTTQDNKVDQSGKISFTHA